MSSLKKIVCYDNSPPFSNAREFAIWINSEIEKVPCEYRESAQIDFTPDNNYGDPIGNIKITYHRPLNDAEQKAADAIDEQDRINQIRRAKATLAKYGVKE
jgi:hypothetical protein